MSVAVLPPAVTVSLKISRVSLVSWDGAWKRGVAVFASFSATPGPLVWVQAKVRASPSGSELALPSNWTFAPSFTLRCLPASAVGGWLFAALTTTTSTASEVDSRFRASLTLRPKVRVSFAERPEGAVKVGLAVEGPVSVTVCPAVWVQV